MKSDSPNHLFKDPNTQIEPLGNLTVRTTFKTSKQFPKTSVACSNLAKAIVKDNQSRKNDINDYSASLEKILQLLDVFFHEKKSDGKDSAGNPENYDLSKNCEFTLFLLWQIRNVMAHCAVIDPLCKKKYEEIFQKYGKKAHPIIPLPKTLELGQEFEIKHNNFQKILKCASKFIKRRVLEEDYKILMARIAYTNFKIDDGFVYLPVLDGELIFSINKASSHGININLKTGMIESPLDTTFSFRDNCIHLKNGESFPAQYVPNSKMRKKFVPDLEL